MTYANFEKIISTPRLYRYLVAAGGDKTKAIILYKANVRLSQQMFGIISFFEIALRNAIDSHYNTHFGHDWLQTQSNVGGFLCAKGCDASRLKPVCFNGSNTSTLAVADVYKNIVELSYWMDIDANVFLQNIDYISEEINFIDLQ